MRFIKLISFLILLLNGDKMYSQNEFMNWYFGGGAGLNFSVSPPATINNNNIMNATEGCACISDSNGNLLFYTNGATVATKNHTIMSNGNGLNGDAASSTQAAIIVKQPGNINIYYIFTTHPNIASYSIVDMNLAAGFGSVTVKNATLYAGTSEKQVAARHCNGKDIWIISHERNSNNFRSYLLSSTGLNTTAVITSIGEVTNGLAALGQMKISPDGRKLAMACNGPATVTTLGNGGFQLFDFDAATGVISNSLVINSQVGAYGVEFSPDGKYLYGGIASSGIFMNAALLQWNICQSSTAAIVASQYSVGFNTAYGTTSIQRAVDDKLYIAPNNPSNFYALHVINNPNNAGAAMGLSLNAISTGTKQVTLGLPNYINNYTKPVPVPFTNSIACQTASFAVPPTPTLSGGCSSAAPSAPSAYLWDFGEPSSGAANSSTLTNPSHLYANSGTYTVSLILFNNCTNDTLKQVVNITTAGPNPQVAGTFTICRGEKQTYTVSGGSTYQWFNNATTNTISLSPTTNTVYSVKSTSNGCSLSKSFSVTVNPCLGIGEVGASTGSATDIRYFPNPVNNELTVSSSIAGQLSIFDMSGRMVLETRIQAGENKISTTALKAGVYVMKVAEPAESSVAEPVEATSSTPSTPSTSSGSNSGAGSAVWRGRLVKME